MKPLEPSNINIFAEMEQTERELIAWLAKATLVLPDMDIENSHVSRAASEIHKQIFVKRHILDRNHTPPQE